MRIPQLALIVLCLVPPAAAQEPAPTGPLGETDPSLLGEVAPLNVVLVIGDDLGVDQVGSYAVNYPCPACSPQPPVPCTPTLDLMASQGLRFTNAWSSPVCSPTRAQIITGKRCSALGIGRATGPFNPRNGMDDAELTLGDLIPLNGFFGKWHLADIQQVPGHPLDCGFYPFAGTMWNVSPPQDGPHYMDWKKYDGINPWVQTFDYVTTDTTDDAIEWIDQLNQSAGPWCVIVSYHASHSPYHCPPGVSAPNNCSMDWHANCQNTCPYQGETCKARAMTQALDAEIGRLLGSIDRTDTAVIFVGDNGTESYATTDPFLQSHGKSTLYQGGINVPMIAVVPGLEPGVNHELVQVADLFSTVLELTGTPVPTGVLGLDSVSMNQYISPRHAAPGAAPRQRVFSEIFDPNYAPENGSYPPGYVAQHHELAIRDYRYKLIEKNSLAGGTTHELYRLYDPGGGPLPQDPARSQDPFELADLMPSQATWSTEVQQAYDDLSSTLAAYVRLPLTTVARKAPAELQEALETAGPVVTCSGQGPRVGWTSSMTARTFLDFDVSVLLPDADVLAVELDLAVQGGFGLEASQVAIRQQIGTVAASTCTGLFASGGPVDYGTASGLSGPGIYTVTLGATAEAALEQVAAAGSGTFSVSLIYSGEGISADLLTLADSGHELRITYGLKP